MSTERDPPRFDPAAETMAAPKAGPVPSPLATAPGASFGRYRVLEELGRGGMGVVWKAWDPELRRTVALKQILEPDPARIDRFLAEARAVARLRHANIVPVHDVGVEEGRHYFTAEYVEGESLDRRLAAGPVPLRTALGIVAKVADALQHAHDQGIVHRDVKPSNLLLDESGDPRVTDFGLARDAAGPGRSTASGAMIGTPRYMSPEQAEGRTARIGPASDQFSLGAVLYELLAGVPPFRGGSIPEVLGAVLLRDPVRFSRLGLRIHRDVETICFKALEKRIEDRYPSMRDLSADIERFLDGEPIQARPPSALERFARRAVRHRALLAVSGAACLAISALLAWIVPAWTAESEARTRAEADLEARELASVHLERGRRVLEEMRIARRDEGPDRERLRVLADRAREHLDRALEVAPRHPEAHLAIGRMRLLAGDEAGALAAFDRAVECDPEFSPAYLERARLRLEEHGRAEHGLARAGHAGGDADGALLEAIERDLEAARRFTTLDEQRLFADAVLAFARSDLALAERLLGDYLRHAPTDGRAFAWRGHALLHLRRNEEAIRALDEAVRSDALDESALVQRAIAHLRRRDLTAAERDLDRALRLVPRHEMARTLRARSRATRGDHAGASEDLDVALAEHPDCPDALAERGVARRFQGDLPGALRDLDRALRLDPGHARARAERGLVHYERGDLAGAIADEDEAIRLDPAAPDPYWYRGAARQERGEAEGALEDYDAAIERDPEFAEAYASRALLRLLLGDPAAARADAEIALRLSPGSARALAVRADARSRTDDARGALEDYDAALRIEPGSFEALAGRARVRARLGDLDGALADADQAVSIAPRGETHLLRGLLRAQRGERQPAIADLERAVELLPPASPMRDTATRALEERRRR